MVLLSQGFALDKVPPVPESFGWGHLQEAATKTAAHLAEQRALASTARAATKKVVEKARLQQDRDVTLRDPKLIENYKVCTQRLSTLLLSDCRQAQLLSLASSCEMEDAWQASKGA